MKKQILAVAGALFLAALAPAPSRAQQVLGANIPFAFEAGGRMMPAGEYQVGRVLLTETVQRISRTDSSASTFVGTNAVDPKDKDNEPKLIFRCYDGECFLSEIWNGNGQGRKVLQSRREKELSRAKAEHELAVVVLPLTVMP